MSHNNIIQFLYNNNTYTIRVHSYTHNIIMKYYIMIMVANGIKYIILAATN